MKKISICTVCMNRLYYLSQTLPVNIKENQGYPNLEFVVLNYNSRDDMDDWMRTHMGQHIESGLVKYYRTDEPEFFNLAHSKNMATKLATGDIICNIDADNYAGPGYVNWVQERFSTKGPGIEITTIRRDAIPYKVFEIYSSFRSGTHRELSLSQQPKKHLCLHFLYYKKETKGPISFCR